MVWYSHLFQNFSVNCDPHSQRLWRSQKAEVDVFLELSYFFDGPMDVGNLISGSSAFSKSSSSRTLETHRENFEHDFASFSEE